MRVLVCLNVDCVTMQCLDLSNYEEPIDSIGPVWSTFSKVWMHGYEWKHSDAVIHQLHFCEQITTKKIHVKQLDSQKFNPKMSAFKVNVLQNYMG